MVETFTGWMPLHTFAVIHLRNHGAFPAVYALRETSTGEILKFGHTGHIRNRIIKNYIGGTGGSTTQRVHTDLFTNGWIDRVEIAWIETTNKTEAEHKEKAFRLNYQKIHGKLPPWDRQR